MGSRRADWPGCVVDIGGVDLLALRGPVVGAIDGEGPHVRIRRYLVLEGAGAGHQHLAETDEVEVASQALLSARIDVAVNKWRAAQTKGAR